MLRQNRTLSTQVLQGGKQGVMRTEDSAREDSPFSGLQSEGRCAMHICIVESSHICTHTDISQHASKAGRVEHKRKERISERVERQLEGQQNNSANAKMRFESRRNFSTAHREQNIKTQLWEGSEYLEPVETQCPRVCHARRGKGSERKTEGRSTKTLWICLV